MLLPNLPWMVCVATYTAFTLITITGGVPLDDYIRDYEQLSYDTVHILNQHERLKRSITDNLELEFSAFNRSFHLTLTPDSSIFTPGHVLVVGDQTMSDRVPLVYQGTVNNEPASLIHGSIIDGVFRGEMHIPGDTVYYIEPSDRFFSGPTNCHSVIYTKEHVNMNPYSNTHSEPSPCLSRLHPQSSEAEPHHESVHNKYSSDSHQRSKRQVLRDYNTCAMELRSDPTLWEYMTEPSANGGLGYSEVRAKEEILSLFASHMAALKRIFLETQFGTYSGVTFALQRTEIMTNTACQGASPSPFCAPNLDINKLLNLTALMNRDEFCLSFLFSFRDFQAGTLGLAWVAQPGQAGGICENFKTVRERNGYSLGKSLNTGVMSILNYNKRVAPLVTQLTFTHEIGHSFGAQHDQPGECAPYKTTHSDAENGNYIMYSSATTGVMLNNDRFSSCSKESIGKVLASVFNDPKKSCFVKSDGSFCGNLIVEKGEACDCGFPGDCTERCCNSAGQDAAKPCSLVPSAKCSPSQGLCCTQSCTFVPNTRHETCKEAEECKAASYCDGNSGFCPEQEFRAHENKFCNNKTQICIRGECTGSICGKIVGGGWAPCSLNDTLLTGPEKSAAREEMCHVSCKGADGNCVSSKNIELLNDPQYKAFADMLRMIGNGTLTSVKLQPGAACNNLVGYCDVYSRCRDVDADGAIRRLLNADNLETLKNWIMVNWWAVLLMCIALVVVMIIFVKCCSKNTRPKIPKSENNPEVMRTHQPEEVSELPDIVYTAPSLTGGPPPYAGHNAHYLQPHTKSGYM